jgi:hypothetical protein
VPILSPKTAKIKAYFMIDIEKHSPSSLPAIPRASYSWPAAGRRQIFGVAKLPICPNSPPWQTFFSSWNGVFLKIHNLFILNDLDSLLRYFGPIW